MDGNEYLGKEDAQLQMQHSVGINDFLNSAVDRMDLMQTGLWLHARHVSGWLVFRLYRITDSDLSKFVYGLNILRSHGRFTYLGTRAWELFQTHVPDSFAERLSETELLSPSDSNFSLPNAARTIFKTFKFKDERGKLKHGWRRAPRGVIKVRQKPLEEHIRKYHRGIPRDNYDMLLLAVEKIEKSAS